jgi:NADH-quinone oxidoreductase E subunit
MSKEEVVSAYKDKKDELITVLQKIQDEEGYISPETMGFVAEKMNIPLNQVYGVVTFYNMFKLKKGGKYLLQLCKGTACHVKGAANLYEHLKTKLKVEDGQTTADGIFTLAPVNCLGMCSLAPCMMINGEVFSKLDEKKLDEILAQKK